MSKLEEAVKTLVGREPTAEEMAKFYRIKETLGLAEHDVVWTFLLAFGHYEILYSEVPERIREVCQSTLADLKVAAEQVAKAAERQMLGQVESRVAETVKSLSDKVLEVGHGLALEAHRKKLAVALGLSIGLAALAIGGAVWGGYRLGEQSMAAKAAWLDTPEGRAAREFTRMNDVGRMLECPAPLRRFSERGETYCNPYDEEKKRLRSWRVE